MTRATTRAAAMMATHSMTVRHFEPRRFAGGRGRLRRRLGLHRRVGREPAVEGRVGGDGIGHADVTILNGGAERRCSPGRLRITGPQAPAAAGPIGHRRSTSGVGAGPQQEPLEPGPLAGPQRDPEPAVGRSVDHLLVAGTARRPSGRRGQIEHDHGIVGGRPGTAPAGRPGRRGTKVSIEHLGPADAVDPEQPLAAGLLAPPVRYHWPWALNTRHGCDHPGARSVPAEGVVVDLDLVPGRAAAGCTGSRTPGRDRAELDVESVVGRRRRARSPAWPGPGPGRRRRRLRARRAGPTRRSPGPGPRAASAGAAGGSSRRMRIQTRPSAISTSISTSGVKGWTPHRNSSSRSASSSSSVTPKRRHTSAMAGPSLAATQGTMASSRPRRSWAGAGSAGTARLGRSPGRPAIAAASRPCRRRSAGGPEHLGVVEEAEHEGPEGVPVGHRQLSTTLPSAASLDHRCLPTAADGPLGLVGVDEQLGHDLVVVAEPPRRRRGAAPLPAGGRRPPARPPRSGAPRSGPGGRSGPRPGRGPSRPGTTGRCGTTAATGRRRGARPGRRAAPAGGPPPPRTARATRSPPGELGHAPRAPAGPVPGRARPSAALDRPSLDPASFHSAVVDAAWPQAPSMARPRRPDGGQPARRAARPGSGSS